MFKFLLAGVCTLVSFFGSTAFSHQIDEPYFAIWDETGKEGFIDINGKIVIACQFDKVTEFSEGLASVKIGDKWGFIDRTGKVSIAARWKQVGKFSDGVAAIVDAVHGYSYSPLEGDGYSITLQSCGYIDKAGRYVIKPSPDSKAAFCPDFVDGIVAVCFDGILTLWFPDFADAGKCGFMDKTGKWSIKPLPGTASNFSEGLSLMRLPPYYDKEAKAWLYDYVYIDKSGKTVIDLKGYQAASSFANGMAQVVKSIGTVRFIDHAGKLRFEVNANSVGAFNNGLAPAQDAKTRRFGYIDLTGKWVIPPKYYNASVFSEGVASVCVEPNECSYVDTTGKEVAEPKGGPFHDGLFLDYLYTRTISTSPTFRNVHGYMNRAGKYVWVSPGGDNLGEKWWKDNYIGPNMPASFSRP